MLSGGTPSTKNTAYWKGTIPWITSKWLNDNLYLRSGEKFISQDAIENSASKIVPSGNLIFATRVGVGKVAVNDIDLAINQDLAGIVIDKQQTMPEFLAYQLRTGPIQQFVEQNKRGATIKGITKSCLSEIALLLPPLPEQRRIAAVLSLVQRVIEQQERLIALTTELKKALMHKLFTEGTRGEPQKQTEIGPIPESWEVVELNTITRIERGKFGHRPRNEPRFYGGDIPFIQTGDVSNCDGHIREYNQTLNEDGLAISRMFPAGTILITIAANIGYTGILCFDSACPDSLIAITPNDDVEAEFLNYYLTTQQPVMDRLAPRGTQKNINIQFLKPWPIPLPGKKEQLEIAAILERVATKHREHAATKDTLSDLFRTLLHQLMTAEIRVNDLDLEEFGLDTEK